MEFHDVLSATWKTLEDHGFIFQGVVRKGITDPLHYDPAQYDVGQVISLTSDTATTFFPRVSHVFTDEYRPYIHVYECKTGVDISGAVAHFQGLLREGEVVLKRHTQYVVVDKGFDPSYVSGNCINGAYVVRFREVDSGLQSQA